MPLWYRDLKSDPEVQALSWEQRGRYLWALLSAWDSGCGGVAEPEVWLRWMETDMADVAIYERLFQSEDGLWTQKRLAAEWAEAVRIKQVRARVSQLGNAVRWHGSHRETTNLPLGSGREKAEVPEQVTTETAILPPGSQWDRGGRKSRYDNVLRALPEGETEKTEGFGLGLDLDSGLDSKPAETVPTRSRRESFAIPDWVPRKPWQAYLEYRRRIRKPLTIYGQGLTLVRIDKLRAEGHDPTAVLEQSIANGWTGVFGVDAPQTNGNGPSSPSSTSLWDSEPER
jgi:hypothetical protein